MTTLLMYVLLLLGGILIGGAVATGRGEYLIDAAIVGAFLFFVRQPVAIVVIFACQCVVRRWPYLAREAASWWRVHPKLVPALLPGAVILDTAAAAQPNYRVNITSSAKRKADDLAEHSRRSQQREDDWAALKKLLAEPGNAIPQNSPIPHEGKTIKLDVIDVEIVERGLKQGLAVSKIAKTLPGANGHNYQEYVAKTRAIVDMLQRQPAS